MYHNNNCLEVILAKKKKIFTKNFKTRMKKFQIGTDTKKKLMTIPKKPFIVVIDLH